VVYRSPSDETPVAVRLYVLWLPVKISPLGYVGRDQQLPFLDPSISQ